MTKAQGIIGFPGIISGVNLSRRARWLSTEELQLVEHYRELSESDRIAMRCLVDAMRSVSRF
ncbi:MULTISPECIES: hypothetical protein [unclassified Pseudomonas]|uniref:hypothetical protein n=1 Tax=unclassified Pseudomonas TaxID=196821 RepID=UPI000BA35FFC|nr:MULTISPECIES: hypothetical protein [unclassified Pseudomonas]